ncbi:MAG: hypothetical protein JWO03_37 [Bacteroidetes bacterium]|nr:hypothetical protein [Bacteroidota bacterium]
MSKLSVIGLFIIVAVIGIFATKKCNRISGSGNVTTEDRTVKPFTKLKLDGVFKTIITQDGGAAFVKVEADQNLQKIIIVKNEGETLTISTQSGMNFNNPTKMVVYVNVKDINSLTNSSVGSTENKGTLKAPALYLKTEAVGKTTLHIETDKLTADLNSVGAIDLSGSATAAEIENNSVGKLDAYHLNTETLDLKNNAVGAAEIYASKELSIDHNGVGSVHYKGAAAIKKLIDNGVGKVSKAD